jgi:hypothetical protein
MVVTYIVYEEVDSSLSSKEPINTGMIQMTYAVIVLFSKSNVTTMLQGLDHVREHVGRMMCWRSSSSTTIFRIAAWVWARGQVRWVLVLGVVLGCVAYLPGFKFSL